MNFTKTLCTSIIFLCLCAVSAASAQAATLYWVGGSGDNVPGNANDWNTADPGACNDGGGNAGAAPGASDVAVFDADCDSNASISANWSLAGLTLSSGYSGTLDLNGLNLTASGTFTSAATIKLQGDETVSTPTLSSGSTVEYSATSGTRDLKSWTYTNATLKINGSGGTFTLPTNITVSGVTLAAGTLDAKDGLNYSITNSGNWTNTGGTFTPRSGQVMLTGTGAVTLTSAASAFNTLNLNDGLVGYWKLDETAANTCTGGVNDSCDSSGYGNDGAWQNQAAASTTVAALNFANARSAVFDGADDYIKIPDASVLNPTSALTLAVWVNYTNTNGNQIFIAKPKTDGSHDATQYFSYSLHALNSGGVLYPRMLVSIGAVYDATDGKWDVIAFSKGY